MMYTSLQYSRNVIAFIITWSYVCSRYFEVSWSYYLGWLGVGSCFITSMSVYILTRIMRSTLPYLV